jgi:FdhD protein
MNSEHRVYRTYSVVRCDDALLEEGTQDFIREEPLLISVADRPYALVMRTPGDETALAAGFCLSEGLVELRQDILSIVYEDRDPTQNHVRVSLSNERRQRVASQLAERGVLRPGTSHVSGREMIEGGAEQGTPAAARSEIRISEIHACVEKFFRLQEHYARTRGTHAVMLFDENLEPIAKSEDVGRHNAMDKSIGALFLENRLQDVRCAVLSCRISYEILQKAARARISVLISKSHPTSMAVDLGVKLNMILISLNKKAGFIVPCGGEKVRTDTV